MGIMYECVCCKNGLLLLLKWVVSLEKIGRFCCKNLSFLFEKRHFLISNMGAFVVMYLLCTFYVSFMYVLCIVYVCLIYHKTLVCMDLGCLVCIFERTMDSLFIFFIKIFGIFENSRKDQFGKYCDSIRQI